MSGRRSRSLRSIRSSSRSSTATGSSTSTQRSRPVADICQRDEAVDPRRVRGQHARVRPRRRPRSGSGGRSRSRRRAAGRRGRRGRPGSPSSSSGSPGGVPPRSELSTSPVSSVLSALARVTVGPAPGTASPTAPSRTPLRARDVDDADARAGRRRQEQGDAACEVAPVVVSQPRGRRDGTRPARLRYATTSSFFSPCSLKAKMISVIPRIRHIAATKITSRNASRPK